MDSLRFEITQVIYFKLKDFIFREEGGRIK